MTPNHSLAVRAAIRSLVEDVTGAGQTDRALLSNEMFPALLAGAAVLTWIGLDWHSHLLQKLMEREGDKLTKDNLYRVIAETCREADRKSVLVATDLFRELPLLGKRVDARLLKLFRACGEGRFSLTLLMATAYEHLLPFADRDGESFDTTPITLCQAFLRRTELSLQGLSRPRCEDRVIELAMQMHAEKAAEPGWPLPKSSRIPSSWQGSELSELLRSVLWHLAVIGQPVIAQVLALAPLIQVAIERLRARHWEHTELTNDHLITEVLQLLELRCLVFHIQVRHIGLS